MACNFIHCFRNPGGDYEWADWDNPPPRYWFKLPCLTDDFERFLHSIVLFICVFFKSPNSVFLEAMNDEKMHHYRRSRSREADRVKSGSGRSHDDERQLFMKQLGVGGAPIITVKAEVMRLILIEVIHLFDAQVDGELSLLVDDYVVVCQVAPTGWSEGECKGGASWFP
ncbi:hypothetical protein WN943_023051 [Citrus x changshan-huyou]